MDRRIAYSLIGVAIMGALAWLTTPTSQDASEAQQAPPQDSAISKAADPESGAASLTHSAVRTSADARQSAGGNAVAVPPVSHPSPLHAAGEPPPIDVSPGFEFLRRPAAEMTDTDPMWTHWRRHQQLESEPRDEAWAPRMEAALRGGIEEALTSRGLDTQRIELPVVECRTNACEIQAVGYAMDNKKPGVDFQDILPTLLRGSLGSEFDAGGFSLLLSSRQDGRLTFLALMPRKQD